LGGGSAMRVRRDLALAGLGGGAARHRHRVRPVSVRGHRRRWRRSPASSRARGRSGARRRTSVPSSACVVAPVIERQKARHRRQHRRRVGRSAPRIALGRLGHDLLHRHDRERLAVVAPPGDQFHKSTPAA